MVSAFILLAFSLLVPHLAVGSGEYVLIDTETIKPQRLEFVDSSDSESEESLMDFCQRIRQIISDDPQALNTIDKEDGSYLQRVIAKALITRKDADFNQLKILAQELIKHGANPSLANADVFQMLKDAPVLCGDTPHLQEKILALNTIVSTAPAQEMDIEELQPEDNPHWLRCLLSRPCLIGLGSLTLIGVALLIYSMNKN